MKITLKHLHHKPSPSLLALLERELASLSNALRIDEARVHLERRTESSPCFRVAFHLVTPGPDVTAEATEHTLRAALLKALESARGKIDHRHLKRARRMKEALSASSPRSRPPARG